MTAAPWDDGQKRKGFGAIRYYGGEYWGGPDPQADEQLSRASVPSTARLVRTVTEGTPRGLMSDQDGGTWGSARFAGGSDRTMFAALAGAPELARLPEARRAFREGADNKLTITSDAARRWFYELIRLPWAQRVYWDFWFTKVLHPAYARAQSLGWRSEMGTAALARIRNSSPAAMDRAVAAARRAGGDEESQVNAALAQYASERPLYASRVAELKRAHTWDALPGRPEATDLYLDAAPRRPDGSPVAGATPSVNPLPWLLFLSLFGGLFFWIKRR
jgi:hypothetical protein